MLSTAETILHTATEKLDLLKDKSFNVLSLSRPESIDSAINLAKTLSKLSPMMGNMIEFNICEYLNSVDDFSNKGKWKRQDPTFPDTIFEMVEGDDFPGIEIKSWLPLSTEITARFKNSQNQLLDNPINVALVAWVPEHIIFGNPKIIDITVVSSQSVASTRDNHYSNPPDYLIIEPIDTSDRSSNLQQTNACGYKFQGTEEQLQQAIKDVQKWLKKNALGNLTLSPASSEYQEMASFLMSKYPYRLDTNFAKIDRINHNEIEAFKERVMNTTIYGKPLSHWSKLLSRGEAIEIQREMNELLKF